MIEFARPLMLIGLLAALLPVAIHLMGRRKAKRVQFSALAFLLQQNPQRARNIRLRERALLALRVAVIALIAIVLAKPLVPSFSDPASVVAGVEPVAAVLVVDDSLSMGVSAAGGATRFSRARDRAALLLSLLPLGSTAAVVTSGFPARTLQPRLRREVAAVADDVRALKWYPRRDDTERALIIARQLLAATAIKDRRIVVLSDLQKSGWARFAPTRADQSVHLVAEPMQTLAASNLSVVAAVAEPATDRGPQHVRVNVEVRHNGIGSAAGHVTIASGERVLKRWLEVGEGESVRRSFVIPADHGTAQVTVPPDDLAADNRRDALLAGAAALRVAIVNGAPRPVPREDEVFFLTQALRLGSDRGDIEVEVVALTDVGETVWSRYDAIVLANVAELSADALRALDVRVKEGAGLLVTAGEAMPTTAKGWPATLLPWRLSGVRVLSERRSDDVPLELADDDAGAAATKMRATLSTTVAALSRAQTTKHALLEPGSSTGKATVLRFADGAPALLLAARGKGRVALWTTSIDRDWSDVALQPGFLPLVGQLVRELGAASADGTPKSIEPGDAAIVRRHDNATTLQVRRETDDGPIVETLEASSQSSAQWRVEGLLEPGRYRLVERSAQAVWTKKTLLVVAPASEMAVNDLDDASRWKLPLTHAAPVQQRPRVPGWPLALLFVMITMLLEGVVLWRMAGGRLAKPIADS